jgi:hypothetical protein
MKSADLCWLLRISVPKSASPMTLSVCWLLSISVLISERNLSYGKPSSHFSDEEIAKKKSRECQHELLF